MTNSQSIPLAPSLKFQEGLTLHEGWTTTSMTLDLNDGRQFAYNIPRPLCPYGDRVGASMRLAGGQDNRAHLVLDQWTMVDYGRNVVLFEFEDFNPLASKWRDWVNLYERATQDMSHAEREQWLAHNLPEGVLPPGSLLAFEAAPAPRG